MNKKRLMSLIAAASSIMGLGKSVSAADYNADNYGVEDEEEDYSEDSRTNFDLCGLAAEAVVLVSLIRKGKNFYSEQTSNILDTLNVKINEIIKGDRNVGDLSDGDSFGTTVAKMFDNRATDRFYAAERFANNKPVTAQDVALAVDYWLQYKKDNVKEHRILMKYDGTTKKYSCANVFVDNNGLHLIDLLNKTYYQLRVNGDLPIDGVVRRYSDYEVLPKYRGNFTDTWTNLLSKSRPFYKYNDVSSFTKKQRNNNLNEVLNRAEMEKLVLN